MRHWHTHEDEFVYVIAGEVVLKTDAGEQVLTAGQCAGFPLAVADGHQFVNRSAQPAVYLEVGNRDDADATYYSDVDLHFNHPACREAIRDATDRPSSRRRGPASSQLPRSARRRRSPRRALAREIDHVRKHRILRRVHPLQVVIVEVGLLHHLALQIRFGVGTDRLERDLALRAVEPIDVVAERYGSFFAVIIGETKFVLAEACTMSPVR